VSLTNATFTDANPGDHTADFTATIDWGDGTAPTTGTVSYNSVTKVYTVAGSHIYAEEGTYTPTVHADRDGQGQRRRRWHQQHHDHRHRHDY